MPAAAACLAQAFTQASSLYEPRMLSSDNTAPAAAAAAAAADNTAAPSATGSAAAAAAAVGALPVLLQKVCFCRRTPMIPAAEATLDMRTC